MPPKRPLHRVLASGLMLLLLGIRIPTIRAASSWAPTLLVNTEAFQVIDNSDSASNIQLKFGSNLDARVFYDVTNARFTFTKRVFVQGSLTTTGALSVRSTMSGYNLHVSGTMSGAGLTDCDTAATSKLLWDTTTGRFSCGSDQTGAGGGSSFGSGNVITIGDARYVNVSGDTMTGALRIDVTGGNLNTLGLRVANTASGAMVHAEKGLTSSGTLVVEGSLIFGDALADAITVNAGAWTFANDTDFALSGGVNGLSFDTDTFSVDALNNRIGIRTTSPENPLEVVGTISGTTLKTTNGITASGAIVTESGAIFDGNTLYISAPGNRVGIGTATPRTALELVGTLSGSNVRVSTELSASGAVMLESSLTGATIAGFGLTDCDTASTSKLLWDTTTKKFSCGTDQGGSGGFTTVEKDADESIASSTALQDDNNLQFTMSASTAYVVEVIGYYTSGASGDFKYSVTPNSNTTIRMRGESWTAAGTSGTTGHTGCNITAKNIVCTNIGTAAHDWLIEIRGIVLSSSTGGTFKIRWAQNTSDGTSTVMKKNSILRYQALAGAADLAEWYFTHDPTIEPGSVVELDPKLQYGVRKTQRAYSRRTLGVVSTNPASIMGEAGSEGLPVAVGLAGRVPVKVNGENGPIDSGDYLTASSTPGIAMRASRAGPIIGMALERFSGLGEGSVLMFIKHAESSGMESERMRTLEHRLELLEADRLRRR